MAPTEIDVHCARCKTHLFAYLKGGSGRLVKCFLHKILKDKTEERGVCPGCGAQFGRNDIIRGKPAIKVKGGAVEVRRWQW